ncbi:hypothetical protein BC829DRAFT_202396 [Chytridium lagenaria]|nr:hypothetical protein BC829DRAFT_202396 [Chytridium lagenaria]
MDFWPGYVAAAGNKFCMGEVAQSFTPYVGAYQRVMASLQGYPTYSAIIRNVFVNKTPMKTIDDQTFYNGEAFTDVTVLGNFYRQPRPRPFPQAPTRPVPLPQRARLHSLCRRYPQHLPRHGTGVQRWWRVPTTRVGLWVQFYAECRDLSVVERHAEGEEGYWTGDFCEC